MKKVTKAGYFLRITKAGIHRRFTMKTPEILKLVLKRVTKTGYYLGQLKLVFILRSLELVIIIFVT